MARMSAAQPDNGAGAGCQASTQLDPVVLKARSAEEPPGAWAYPGHSSARFGRRGTAEHHLQNRVPGPWDRLPPFLRSCQVHAHVRRCHTLTLTPLSPRLGLRDVLPEPERNDPLDQVVRHWLIERELEVSLGPHVSRQRSLQPRIA